MAEDDHDSRNNDQAQGLRPLGLVRLPYSAGFCATRSSEIRSADLSAWAAGVLFHVTAVP